MSRQIATKTRKNMTLTEIEEKRNINRENLNRAKLKKKYLILSEKPDNSSITMYSEEIVNLQKESGRLRKMKYDKVHEDEIREKRRNELKKKIDSLKH